MEYIQGIETIINKSMDKLNGCTDKQAIRLKGKPYFFVKEKSVKIHGLFFAFVRCKNTFL